MKTITTDRLILRQWSTDDATDLYEYAKNPNVGPCAGWKPHKSTEESAEIIKHFLNEDDTWAITDKQTGKVIGSAGLHSGRGRRLTNYTTRELGYVLSEDYWGKGLMVEACREVLRFAFCEMNIDFVTVGHFDFNDRSRRVIEKLGFTYDGHISYCYELDGKLYGESLYFMTKQDYLSHQ